MGTEWEKLGMEFLTQILPIIIAFIGALFLLLRSAIQKHVKNNDFKAALDWATNLIEAEVGKAESIAVKAAKLASKTGRLTDEQGEEIKADVLDLIDKQLSADTIEALRYKIPNVTAWIDAQLQKEVATWSNKDTTEAAQESKVQ